MPMKKKEAKGESSAPDVAPEEPKMDIKSILKDIEFLGSSHMTWKEKKTWRTRSSSGAKKAAERCRPEDRVLRAIEGNLRNGVLNVKHLLQPSTPRGADDNGRHAISKGKKKKSGKKGHGKGKGGGRKRH
ncbi:hypothetical protein Sango_0098000 [Sesamum angolense]|uniref:Uncharacterized protein n=1 Tax=Sesamum angolense TaxID=2727404 RepID=A0AAE1XE33_9LAMI|nr:hypothetical protein Sango_0098000 [Sesamum angolense]